MDRSLVTKLVVMSRINNYIKANISDDFIDLILYDYETGTFRANAEEFRKYNKESVNKHLLTNFCKEFDATKPTEKRIEMVKKVFDDICEIIVKKNNNHTSLYLKGRDDILAELFVFNYNLLWPGLWNEKFCNRVYGISPILLGNNYFYNPTSNRMMDKILRDNTLLDLVNYILFAIYVMVINDIANIIAHDVILLCTIC